VPDEFLTVAEVAETLKVAGQTVRNWIDRGELTAVRVGSRRVRIRREDLDAFLAGREAEPDKPRRADRVEELERKVVELEARLEIIERTD